MTNNCPQQNAWLQFFYLKHSFGQSPFLHNLSSLQHLYLMGDPPKSLTPNFYSILGIPKTAFLAAIGRAYKSLVMKWHPDRNPFNKAEAEANI